MDRSRVIVLVATLLVAALAASVAGGAAQPQEPGTADVRLVDLGVEDHRLWPYTSKHAAFHGRTLAVTLIVYDEPETVRHRLGRRTELNWTEVNESEETGNFSVTVNETAVGFGWTPAHGSMRYTYLERAGRGQWLPQRYQLHAGTYLGTRSHVRAFAPSGDSEWTALQTHGEYWDWFRLRHTVTDVWETGREMETDFADQPLVTDVVRAHATNRGPMSGGISVVRVAALTLVASVGPVRRRFADAADAVTPTAVPSLGSLALFGFALGVPLFVRAAGIGLEQALPGLPPKYVAAPLYILLVVGLPVGVYRLGQDAGTGRAAALAAGGFLLGVWLDFVAVGAGAVAMQYAWHRLTLAAGLGAIAGGSRERGVPRALVVAGFLVWSGAVLAAALDLV